MDAPQPQDKEAFSFDTFGVFSVKANVQPSETMSFSEAAEGRSHCMERV